MSNFLNDEKKIRHPYYQIMELQGVELENELNSWSRLELIEWLAWNDRNGIYRDADSQREFGNILGKEEAIEIISKHILQD